MNAKTARRDSSVTSQQVLEHFHTQSRIEKERTENREKVMKQQLSKATGGKGIVISNKGK